MSLVARRAVLVCVGTIVVTVALVALGAATNWTVSTIIGIALAVLAIWRYPGWVTAPASPGTRSDQVPSG